MDPTIIAAAASATGLIVAAAIAARRWATRKKTPHQWSVWMGAVMAGAVFLVAFAVTGSMAASRTLGAPRISITQIPPADAGEGGGLERIGGVVRGRVASGARVVVYAYTDGHWFVQPGGGVAFTPETGPDWTASTHSGTQYAALLVGPGFDPPPVALSLPSGENVLASTEIGGRWGDR
jgi:hypothetical protein